MVPYFPSGAKLPSNPFLLTSIKKGTQHFKMSLLVQPALHTQAGCTSHAVVKLEMGYEVCV